MEKELDCGCGSLEGELHDMGCDMESCPFCGGQLISCECPDTILNPKPGTQIYNKSLADLKRIVEPQLTDLNCLIALQGMSQLQGIIWMRRIEKKGRIPFIRWPQFCAYCGMIEPDFFSVSKNEWEKYIEPDQRDKIVCHACYDRIKKLIDKGGNKKGAKNALYQERGQG